ncbi:MAG: hypothetical protein JWO37_1135 [Acidimicrobiales bacterium]|jgi:uncharacterized protein YjbJ (UPF0337 family)|nr:hypothetical protein [Acidimicrobiales bacterium]
MRIGTVETNHLKGLFDKGAGLAKEAIGTFVNNDRLVKEGEAQQARAAEELKALRKEAEAQAKELKADALEGKQRAAQATKEQKAS